MKFSISAGLAAALSLACALGAFAADPDAVDHSAIAKALAPSLVRVEIMLKHDKGDAPMGGRLMVSPSEFVNEERPLELGGYALSPTEVLIEDPLIHPRFVASIGIRVGDQLIPAKVSSYAVSQNGLFLTAGKALPNVKPLKFEKVEGKLSLLSVSYERVNGEWSLGVLPATQGGLVQIDRGRSYEIINGRSLIVTPKGQCVGVSLRADQPADGTWKGSPLDWQRITQAQLDKMDAHVADLCTSGVLHVSLSFRSPKKSPVDRRRAEEDEEDTEQNVLGVLLDDKTVAVLANLKPQVTARLDRIAVHSGDKAVPAKFSASLKDYGVFLATLEKPLLGALKVSPKGLTELHDQILISAEIFLQGEKSVSYFLYDRVRQLDVGLKGKLYPDGSGNSQKQFLFDSAGNLLALPVEKREDLASTDRYRRYDNTQTTPLAYLKDTLADLASNTDKSNIPLSEEQENRLAWLGLVLQPLNRDLARENNVSSQTQDGETGALVCYVYPGSPADKAGIKIGYILLRLQFKDLSKPLDVRVENPDVYGRRGFPWERLDQLPESIYDSVPPPWPSAEDAVVRTLTKYGFGKAFTAEFFNEDKIVRKDFTVEQGPPHYNSSPHFKSAELGLTVRDLTYELRRYFQKKDDEPGVIISMEEPGGKASIMGLKPFEIITHINGQPVMTVKDFQRLAAGQKELKLSITRMTKGRQVKVTLGEGKPNTRPATTGPTEPAATAPADGNK